MSTLIVYYSLDGNTKFIAEKIAEAIDADIVELKIRRKYPADGFWKYFLGGASATFGEKPKLINERIELDRYESIIIGTPIWAGSFTPPIKSFISKYKIRGKRIALFASHQGGGAEKCFNNLKKALPGNEFIGETDYIQAKEHPENSEGIVRWAAGLAL
jgi:flavodoxin